MNDEGEFKDEAERSLVAEEDAVRPLDFGDSFDFLWEDYLFLPGLGRDYYNLPDAALLGAIDAGLSGRVPGVLPEHWGSYESDEAEFRRGVAPTQKRILDLLTRCVISGLLKAEIKARSPLDSSLIPDRTYVSLSDLIDCLETHGSPRGDYFGQELEDDASAMQTEAQATARARAEFRHGTGGSLATLEGAKQPGEQPEVFWKRVAESQSLAIAELRTQIDGGRPAHPQRELSTKERNTLLTLIAVLCQQANLDPAKTAKTAGVLQAAAARMGIGLGETTIENKLKAIPDAVASRLK